jgi:chaperone required for assembly of F1-ATPase
MRGIFSDMASDPDPIKRSQKQMQKPLPRRFYSTVATDEAEGGFRILLDEKPVRTPARHLLVLPDAALAELCAEEWRAQDKEIDPATMPLTRLVNTALDGVASDMQAVGEDVSRFSGTDLVCYRAPGPDNLVARQSEAWDELLDWSADELGARFVLAEGVMHVAQPREAIAAFGAHIRQFASPLALAALHLATSLSGSAIIAMALAKGEIGVDEAWAKAHVDEDWNAELWGEDHEARKRRDARRMDFVAAARVLAALRR